MEAVSTKKLKQKRLSTHFNSSRILNHSSGTNTTISPREAYG
uniref:Uncharacterized protein n=1 Tax=Tetraselmis sp. GSL018 TaxID=582737 RepID=A0A061R228_9CHLO